jgi:thermitase
MLRRLVHLGVLAAFCALLLPSLATAAQSRAEREAARSIVVEFRPSVSPSRRTELLSRAGALPVRTIDRLGAVVARVDPRRRAAALASLRASGATRLVQGVHVVRASALVPTDPGYVSRTWPWDTLGFPYAWGVTTGAPSVVIAIVDTGVFAASSDLAGRVLPGTDIVNGDANADDDQGHGTEVATTAAGSINNAFGAAGACPGCTVLPVKVLDASGAGTDTAVAAGITWATDNGAEVINLSLGGAYNDPLLADAVAYAQSHDVLVVAAAGNNASSQPEYPGAFPGVISVGASNQSGGLMDFSQFGPWVDLAASGCVNAATKSDTVDYVCGTSFAAPLVSGAAGLVRTLHPAWTADQVRTQLESTAMVTSADVRHGMLDAANVFGWVTPPYTVFPPFVSGVAQSGQTLVATLPLWLGSSPLTTAHQWYRCPVGGGACSAVVGATGTTYTLSDADIGWRISFRDSGTNSVGTTPVDAPASEAVVSAFAPSPAPAQPPASVPGTPPPAATDPDATSPTTLPPDLVVAPSLPPQSPSIVGNPAPGERLSADPGSLDDTLGLSVGFAWQVLRSGAWRAVPRATDQDFDVPSSFAGQRVRVLVTSRNPSGAVVQQSSSEAVTIKAPKTVKKLKLKLKLKR